MLKKFDVATMRCSTVHKKPLFLHVEDMKVLMINCLLMGDVDTARQVASGMLPLKKDRSGVVGTVQDLL